MLWRLISALVVFFWLATTSWLVRSVWFADDAAFEAIDNEEALGAFFGWNETSTLAVLDNGRRIGQMVVSGFEGRDPRTGLFSRGLSTQGTLDESGGSGDGSLGNLVGTSWRMTAEFDEDSTVQDMEVALRVPKQEMNVRLELGGEPRELGARVMVGEMVLFETGRLSIDGDKAVAGKTPPTGKSPPPPTAMSWLPGGALMADPEAWKPKITASRGLMTVAGSSQPVFRVEVRFTEDESIEPVRIYLSEAGEPWRIDTGWGFEAVAEVLTPVDDRPR